MSGKLKIKGDVMKVSFERALIIRTFSLMAFWVGHKDGAGAEKGADEGEIVARHVNDCRFGIGDMAI